ncbi:MAG: thiamine pyrophosphate-binding protein [Nitrososphaera sp.]
MADLQKTGGVRVADYLIKSLYGCGVRHVFGVPGDYVLGFYDRLEKTKRLEIVTTCDEQGAGFAADAYARIRGLGVVCITYGVGGLKVANTTSQAFAEKSPVIVISGSPGMDERLDDPLLHHKVSDFGMQKRVFDEMTCEAAVIDDAGTAAEKIDRVIRSVLRFKQPGYIEIPRDVAGQHIRTAGPENPIMAARQPNDTPTIREAGGEAVSMILAAKKPVIIAGEEIHRFGLQETLLLFIQRTGIPAAATILGKSVIDELHPLYAGIYEGAVGRKETREFVESSDCIIILGASLSDVTLGMFTAKLDRSKTIYAASEKIAIRHHRFDDITMQGFLEYLAKSTELAQKAPRRNDIPHPPPPKNPRATPGSKITVDYLVERINFFLKDGMMVLADVGDSLFASADIVIRGKTKFLSPAYYASLGFAVPGSIGAQMAEPSLRPLVLVGDGAFQMTGIELATAAKYKLNPIVIVLNNGIYLTEESILPGQFNDLQPWDYSRMTDVVGNGRGFVIETEEELDAALAEAEKSTGAFCLLDVRLSRSDRSRALQQMSKYMSQKASFK